MDLNKKKGYSLLEISFVIAIILTLGGFSYSNLNTYMEEEKLRGEKNDIIQLVSSVSRKSYYSNSKIYMYLNTEMPVKDQFKRGVYIFYPKILDPINGEITGGYFDYNISDNNSLINTTSPKMLFQCDNPKSALKFCPVIAYEKNNIPVGNLDFLDKLLPLKKIEFSNGNLNTNLTFYLFNSKGFFNRKIYFYSKNSIVQVYSYVYKGVNQDYLKRINDDENIRIYHEERKLKYPLGNDPDWEKEDSSLPLSDSIND